MLYFQRQGGEQEVGTRTCRSCCSRRREGLNDSANKINAFDATSVVEEWEKKAGDVAGQNAGLIDGIKVPRQQPQNSVPTVVMVWTSSSSYASSSSTPTCSMKEVIVFQLYSDPILSNPTLNQDAYRVALSEIRYPKN